MLASGDVIAFVDVSDPTQSAQGSLVKGTLTQFYAAIPVPIVITSASANALAVGRLGATTPAFTVDASTASQVAGLKVTGAATAGTVAVVVIDSGANANLSVNAKGSGTIAIGSVSTGAVTITPATTITGGLTTASSLTATLGTITASTPALTSTVTWNSGGVTFNHIFADVTDTASAAASRLVALRVGGNDKFCVRKDGGVSMGAGPNTSAFSIVSGTFTPVTIGQVMLIDGTVNMTAGNSAWGFRVMPTLVEAGSGDHAPTITDPVASIYVGAPAITAGAGSTSYAASLYVGNAPSGGTNNYTAIFKDGTTWIGRGAGATELQIGQTGTTVGETPKIQFVTGTSTANAYIQADHTAVGDLKIVSGANKDITLNPGTGTTVISASGKTAMGTTVVTGAAANEVVIPNAKNIRAVNAAGTNTLALLSLSGADRTTLTLGSTSLHLASPATATTIGANGAATALTANPVGYIQITFDGVTFYQIPYYNVA